MIDGLTECTVDFILGGSVRNNGMVFRRQGRFLDGLAGVHGYRSVFGYCGWLG